MSPRSGKFPRSHLRCFALCFSSFFHLLFFFLIHSACLTFHPGSLLLSLICNQHFGRVVGVGIYVFLESNPCLYSADSASDFFLTR